MKVELPYGPFTVAVSGGIDSMVLANFVLKGRKNFDVLHFNHRTECAGIYVHFVEDWCEKHSITLNVHHYPFGPSNELSWSNWRNTVMQNNPRIVLTAHHANDSLESFLMRGKGISPINGNIHRPLLNWKKSNIKDYAIRNNIEYVDDPTNESIEYRRNRIRNVLIPEMVKCGIDPFNLMKC